MSILETIHGYFKPCHRPLWLELVLSSLLRKWLTAFGYSTIQSAPINMAAHHKIATFRL